MAKRKLHEESTQNYKTVSGKKLHRSDFAWAPTSNPADWKLPIDKPRVQAAMSRFNQTQGIPADKKKGVARKIANKARKYGVDPSGFVKKYVSESSVTLLGAGPFASVFERAKKHFESREYTPPDAAAMA